MVVGDRAAGDQPQLPKAAKLQRRHPRTRTLRPSTSGREEVDVVASTSCPEL